ncbi:hypothetical protein ER308_07360 [Egibacter rhizosphaerae]|uniref:Uncharacterized protein n=1 Tax=Egibacter rhizosphaerae TaxID=1670831 RepID=A0A411YDS7_9ACTN|nr:hypothetical protein [Egibacter rhizosphaerae]QBI19383.1 hypothetical protein ER308_07360 [Egibacter rhizosphaerae]
MLRTVGAGVAGFALGWVAVTVAYWIVDVAVVMVVGFEFGGSLAGVFGFLSLVGGVVGAVVMVRRSRGLRRGSHWPQ